MRVNEVFAMICVFTSSFPSLPSLIEPRGARHQPTPTLLSYKMLDPPLSSKTGRSCGRVHAGRRIGSWIARRSCGRGHHRRRRARARGNGGQGLTLSHFSDQLEPFLTQTTP